MKRAIRLAILLLPFVASVLCAAPTAWWNAAYNGNSMLNKDQATTWLANNGDNMTKIVRTMYGIPADKQSTIDRVIDAVIKYNNALDSDKTLFNGDKVTPIVDRNKIYEGKTYFVPDPTAINRILNGEDPGKVMAESMANPQNRQQASGTATSTPLHALGSIEPGASDGEAAAPSVAPPPSPAAGSPEAPILGGFNSNPAALREAARTDMLDVRSEPGPRRADGATDSGDTIVERNHRGNVTLLCAWDFVNAPGRLAADGSLIAAKKTGIAVGDRN